MRDVRKRSALVLVVTWILLAIAIAAGLVIWTEVVGRAAVLSALRAARPWFILWRLFLLTVLLLYWRPMVAWTAKRFRLSQSSEVALREWRWRAAVGVVVMDLVLVEDLLGLLRHAA